MRLKQLFLLGSFIAMGTGVTAQTTLSAADVEIVPGETAELTLDLSTPGAIAGWQAVLTLPEGISVETETGKLTVGDSQADATLVPGVTLSDRHSAHQVVGAVNGQQLLLVCVPTANEQELTGTSGQLCKVTLKADASYTSSQQCTISGFLASDKKGSASTYTATAKQLTVKAIDDTGIHALQQEDTAPEVYNVAGQRVGNRQLQKGVYIVNGKKVAVKK